MRRWLIPILAVALAGSLATVVRASGTPPFKGAILTHPAAPPDIALRDQHGRVVRLSALHGKAVLVTFLYTHCPDVCPLTALNLNSALGLVGSQAKNVAVLAVSVDPQGDTPAAVRGFIRSHHLREQFHYLTGSAPALDRVWRAYKIEAVRGGKDSGVDHTLYTLLVDRKGIARVLFDALARPPAIAHDLRLVLA